jgi:hypothetical protein
MKTLLSVGCVLALGFALFACANPCQEYVDTVCGCDGVEDFYEAIGTSCTETYQPLIDEGDPEACDLANDAFEAAGGCDQFGMLGDDDDTA